MELEFAPLPNTLCNSQANSFSDQFGSGWLGLAGSSESRELPVKHSFSWCWLSPRYQQEAIPLGQVRLRATSKAREHDVAEHRLIQQHAGSGAAAKSKEKLRISALAPDEE